MKSAPSTDKAMSDDFLAVTRLSSNAIRDICDSVKQAEVKTQFFYIQATEVKVFTEQDNKKNIKQR